MLSRNYDEVYARLGTDGWIAVRATFALMVGGEHPPATVPTTSSRPDHLADRRERALAVALDPQGKLRHRDGEIDGDHVVAIVGERMSDDYLAELRAAGVSYVFADADGHDVARAMDAIGQGFGVGALALQGGGTVNGAFLAAGLIDEISLLVHPAIDGLSGIPSIFEFSGAPDERPAQGHSLRHVSTETLDGGTVWLRYEVRREGRP